MAKRPALSPAGAKAAIADLLDKLPPATRVTIDPDMIGLPPKGGWPGYVIRVMLDFPAGPRPGQLVET